MGETTDELFAEGMRALPVWNDAGADRDERRARAVSLITRAAAAGHIEAMERLARGLDSARALDWSIALARLGDASDLVMALTNGSASSERCLGVLDAARLGEPWAELAVGGVYRLGMRSAATQELIATTENGYGWLPATPDPDAEGRSWIERAAARGWAAASLDLASADLAASPAQGLDHMRSALRDGGVLTPKQRKHAMRLHADLLERSNAPIAERIAAREPLADSGDADSIAWLGDRYRLGEGVDRDLARARALYERGVAGNSVDACRELGRMCEEGLGGEPDSSRARELYELAAEQGADAFSRDRLAEKFGLAFYARKSKKKAAKKKPGRGE